MGGSSPGLVRVQAPDLITTETIKGEPGTGPSPSQSLYTSHRGTSISPLLSGGVPRAMGTHGSGPVKDFN